MTGIWDSCRLLVMAFWRGSFQTFVYFCKYFWMTYIWSAMTLFSNKHLMTGHKGNSEFWFPETLNVSRGEAEVNIEVEGKQNSLFPEGPVIKCFVIPPKLKNRRSSEKNYLLEAIAYTGCARKTERLPKPTCSIEKSQKQSFSSQLTKNIDSTKVALASSNA